MRRLLLALLVVASVLFQSLAAAGQGVMAHAVEGLENVLMHAENTPHHHDDDGALHEDDSEQSARHLQADNALSLVALPSLAASAPQQATPPAIVSDQLLEAPPPVLDGPTRPPRLAG